MGKRTLLTTLIVSVCTLSLAGLSQIWTCPMHPQIKQSSPGRCPLCGMNLSQVSNNSSASASSSSKPGRSRTELLEEQRKILNKNKFEKKENSSTANISGQESKTSQTKILSLEDIYSKEFPLVIVSLGEVVKAIQSGDKQTELSELNKALGKLLSIYDSLSAHVNTQFANSLRCPIKGSPINPEDVTNNLIRQYKGKKIAFCCAECPPSWDKLSDVQKHEKLPNISQ